MEALVSIIIPAYNRAELIGETLDSVLEQSYPNWECIVVDDGSTDNTKEVVQIYVDKDPRFILVDRPDSHKPGGNGARNYGFKISKGEFVGWLDSDDLITPFHLEKSIDNLTHTMADVTICNTEFVDNNGQHISYHNNHLKYKTIYENILTYAIAAYIGTLIWKKDFLLNKRLFDENLLRGQEAEFHTRIFLIYEPKMILLKEYHFKYRQHCQNKTTLNESGSEEILLSGLETFKKLVLLVRSENKLTKSIEEHFLKSSIEMLILADKQNYSEEIRMEYHSIFKELRIKSGIERKTKLRIGYLIYKITRKPNLLFRNKKTGFELILGLWVRRINRIVRGKYFYRKSITE